MTYDKLKKGVFIEFCNGLQENSFAFSESVMTLFILYDFVWDVSFTEFRKPKIWGKLWKLPGKWLQLLVKVERSEVKYEFCGELGGIGGN